ncbi:MAG: DUF882 domain-containing protein [Desulfuromonadales bacterium]|nr:MAG: DUF882 domain-containing protein [Desulfuromonadales bacterium]
MIKFQLNRRSFLKAALAGALLLADGRGALAAVAEDLTTREGRLRFYNTHTTEKLDVLFRTSEGEYDQEALKAINWVLRCHYTNHVAEMDVRTLDYLNRLDNRLGGGHEIHIISGYRSPDYNAILRDRGKGGVAKRSLHMEGKALDIAIPGIELASIRKAAISLRKGGVGYYPSAGFVHIDSGGFRTW